MKYLGMFFFCINIYAQSTISEMNADIQNEQILEDLKEPETEKLREFPKPSDIRYFKSGKFAIEDHGTYQYMSHFTFTRIDDEKVLKCTINIATKDAYSVICWDII